MKLINNIKKSVNRTAFKKSGYMSVITVLAIAIIIVINVFVSSLSTTVTELDVSQTHLYSIGDTTKGVLDKLEDDVEIIVVADESDVDARIKKFISLYEAYSKHVTVTYMDPTVYPSVLTTYDTSANTIVVKCEAKNKTRTIDFDDIIEYNQYYYYYYGQYVETAFDGEGQLTTAINYVSADNDSVIYFLTDHGETEMNDTLAEKVDRSNIAAGTWSLNIDGTDIPDDCTTLIINAPTSDISESELESLEAYLAKGGNIIYIMSDNNETLTNLETLMAEYGISTTHGYVGDSRRYYQYYQSAYVFFPKYSTGSVTGDLDDSDELTLLSQPMDLVVTDVDDVVVDEFLTTSSSGVYTTGASQDYETGTYTVAVSAVKIEDSDNDISSSLTVYSTPTIINESLLSASLANGTVFMNSITQYYEDVDNISIDSVSLETQYNTFTSVGYVIGMLVIFMLAMIIIGIVVWNHRRKL